MIEDYTPGRMTVKGEKHDRDLKIIGDRVVREWWRREGHRLEASDIKNILKTAPDVLVIGMGYDGRMRVEETLRTRLALDGIEMIAENTHDAARTFNDLRSKGKNVAGAFHLTC